MRCKSSTLLKNYSKNQIEFPNLSRVRHPIPVHLSVIIVHFLYLYMTQSLAVQQFVYKYNEESWLSVFLVVISCLLSYYSEFKVKIYDYQGEDDQRVSYPTSKLWVTLVLFTLITRTFKNVKYFTMFLFTLIEHCLLVQVQMASTG